MSLVTPSHRTRWWRPLARADALALVVLCAVPTVLFVIPALVGHPSIADDNLIQNFPLRVLSGRDIASGHLPLFNPFANSGTPLLGGLNAGALYPFTFLFAFLPPVVAWVVNLILIYVIAATGLFALLRWHGMRTLAAAAAALSFSYSGAMIGQLVHVGVVQGFAFLPWEILILVSLSRRLSVESATASWRHYGRISLPWVLGYALLWGMTFLTGEPRGIADVELVTLVVAPAVLLLRSSYWMASWRARCAYTVALGVGLLWGIAIGLVQLLPGRSFIGFSQRSDVTYWFFGAGSLVVRWTALLLVPDFLGGNGSLGQPAYFSHYNLPEVTGYAGLLALMATFAFFTRVTARGWKNDERDYVLYVVLVVVGLFAAWGQYTPLGHLFRHIPEYGSTRLQSRNIIVVDVAVAVLLGWWLNRLQARKYEQASVVGARRWLTVAPAVAVLGLCAAVLLWGPRVVRTFGVLPQQASLASQLRLSEGLHFVVALAALATVLWWIRSKHALRLLLGVLTVDLAVFLLLSATSIFGGGAPTEPSRTHALALFGKVGRTALIDEGGTHTNYFHALGTPNMNVFTGVPSVQGYGSLISTIYNATGTHPQSALDPCQLADGTFHQLRLSVIAITSRLLAQNTQVPPPTVTNCKSPQPGPRADRYFGRVLRVRSISLHGRGNQPVARAMVSLTLLDDRGRDVGRARGRVGANQMTFTFGGSGPRAAGFELSATSPIAVGDARVSDANPSLPTWRLDSPFQEALDSSAWRLTKTVGNISIFRSTSIRPPAWLAPGATNAKVSRIHSAIWGDTWVNVRTDRTVALIRSMAYLPGWRATAFNLKTGASRPLSVRRNGLIQQVSVPPGTWTIHFHYHAPYIELGLATTTMGFLSLFGVAGLLIVVDRRKREVKVAA